MSDYTLRPAITFISVPFVDLSILERGSVLFAKPTGVHQNFWQQKFIEQHNHECHYTFSGANRPFSEGKEGERRMTREKRGKKKDREKRKKGRGRNWKDGKGN